MGKYLIDLHVHTKETSPCGKTPAAELVRLYKDRGYDAIAVTDHYHHYYLEKTAGLPWQERIDAYMRGYEAAAEEGERVGLKVYFGMEFRDRLSEDDFLVYGLDRRFLLDTPELQDLSVKEAAGRIHAYGGVIYQAHPARIRYAMRMGERLFSAFGQEMMLAQLAAGGREPEHDWFARKELLQMPQQLTKMRVCNLREPELLDGIEAYNGNLSWCQDPRDVEAILRKYPHLKVLAASDCHIADMACTGGVYTETLPADEKELVQLLKNDGVVDCYTSFSVEIRR